MAVRIAVLGCGRIGRMHAANIARHPRATLAGLYDINREAAAAVGRDLDVAPAETVEAILESDDVDAVLIATATATHAELIERASAAGKAVLCEKPIDLDLARVDACARAIAGRDVPIQIGFNRRFDPGHRAARRAVEAGEIGELHQVVITSRDPEMPPRAYYESAGGLMRDMTIHDFDLARYMLGEEPVEVFALAGRLIDPDLMAELDDHDSAMILMRTASGRQCHINNSRTAVYGYDQRVELMGSRGMVLSDNRRPHDLRRFCAERTGAGEPYLFFFVERYAEAFLAELDSFITCIEAGGAPEVGFEDGRRALVLAEAAYRSVREGRMVRVDEIG
jgi:myo-inositol 2-dehydrogenase/D-chiro-inositol 1-dehydrogenase